MNNSATSQDYPFKCDLQTDDVILLVAYVCVVIVGVAGNLLVCLIFKTKFFKGPIIELLILYLGVFDLIGSILGPFVFIYWILVCGQQWHFGWLGCKTLPLFSRVSTNVSIGIILIMAIDRCRAIVFPMKKRIPRYAIHAAVGCTLLLSVVWEAYYVNAVFTGPRGTCKVVQVDTASYAYPLIVLTSMRVAFFVLIFSITTLAVYRKLHHVGKNVLLRNSSMTRQNKSKMVMGMLVTMAAVFSLSVLPRDLFHLIFTWSWLDRDGINSSAIPLVNKTLRLLQISNGIYNVFIYGKMHGTFAKRVKSTLLCQNTQALFRDTFTLRRLDSDATKLVKRITTFSSYSDTVELASIENCKVAEM